MVVVVVVVVVAGKQPIVDLTGRFLIHPNLTDILIKGRPSERVAASHDSLHLQSVWRLGLCHGQPPVDTVCAFCQNGDHLRTCPICNLTMHASCVASIRAYDLGRFLEGFEIPTELGGRIDIANLDRWYDPALGRVAMCDICFAVWRQ